MQKILHNKISKKNLKKFMLSEKISRITLSFYKYFNIDDPINFSNELYKKFKKIKVFGRIYISKEGINAQISVPKNNFIKMKKIIYITNPLLKKIFMNKAIDDNGKSFYLLKIKVRKKILSDGINDKKYNYKKNRKYLKAEEVNEMIENKNAILVDMRNDYEYEIGHFINALKIPAKIFRNQLIALPKILKNKKNKNIILYCTGGIRCEKSSSLMEYKGFNNVYQIKGGILEYVKRSKKKNLPIYFKGKLFVFDERISEKITNDILSNCHQCGASCDKYVNCRNNSCHLLFIQCNNCGVLFSGFCSNKCFVNKKQI